MVSVTALAATGANLVLFTTGRGTPMGGVVPTMKISSNSLLYSQKPHWIDFDAGQLLSGETLERAAEKLYFQLIDVASGI
jgi:altronate hydrolase